MIKIEKFACRLKRGCGLGLVDKTEFAENSDDKGFLYDASPMHNSDH